MTSTSTVKKRINLSNLSKNPDKNKKKIKSDLDNNNTTLINTELLCNTSKYFQQVIDIPTKLIELTKSLSQNLHQLKFSNISYVYDPTEYALDPYSKYVQKYCRNEKEILFVGMNPGPFGMCQSGVPFGDVKMVQEWLEIVGEVHKPNVECSHRPVLGFESKRREESGKRLWNYFKNLSGKPEIFFKHCFIYNYVPLAFLDNSGKNITPASLKGECKKNLESICNVVLLEVIELLKPKIIINIGNYAYTRVQVLIKNNNLENIRNICMKHPSPIAGSEDKWIQATDKFLETEKLLHYFKNNSQELTSQEST